MRPRADERHVAREHIEELGDLVDIPAPQPAPDPGQPRIGLGGLPDYRPVLERAHGAKLDDAKRLLVETVTPLHEEDRAWAVEFDQDSDQDQKRRRRDERAGREDEIEDAFLDDLAPRER